MVHAKRTENGYSNLAAMKPKPFKKCTACGTVLASSQTECQNCPQSAKGIPAAVNIKPSVSGAN